LLADFLAEFLTYSLVDLGTHVKGKTVLLVFGLLVIVASIGGLLYVYSLPPTTVEDYHNTEIGYSRAYLDDSKNYSNVILVSGEQNYVISSRIWQKSYSSETVVDNLNNYRRAKVWLSSPDSHEIKGIVTQGFSIDPSVGVAWDNENKYGWSFLCWLFFGLGSFLIFTLLLSALTEKKTKRNWWK
jgi:hypothetical protein